jgi:SM-20-related protein
MPVTDASIIDLAAVEKTNVTSDPFPYLVISNFLHAESEKQILKDFPRIEFPGSVPVSDVQFGSSFQRLLEELQGDPLRAVIEKKLDVDLTNRPTLITLRGRTRAKDGQIHADTKSKIVTLLLYLNPVWTDEGGRLRILRSNQDLENYVQEIPPTYGTCLIFKVTDNCWHGHKPFEGERRSIQLNYLTSQKVLQHHLSKHHLSARLKSWKRWFSRGDEY